MSEPVSEAEIARLVATFYERVRAHPVLVPVFAAAIGEGAAEWAAHEEKLCRFWSSLMRRSGAYHGDPYGAHLRLPGLTPAMFTDWLALFEACAAETLPPQTALAVAERAGRVARSLRMGIFERIGA